MSRLRDPHRHQHRSLASEQSVPCLLICRPSDCATECNAVAASVHAEALNLVAIVGKYVYAGCQKRQGLSRQRLVFVDGGSDVGILAEATAAECRRRASTRI